MNDMQLFKHPTFGTIRTTEVNGVPWFVGKDVAAALGYKDTINALKLHVDIEDKQGGWQITTPSGTQPMTIINESGLYSLVLSSKLPTAKKFKRWVTSEVLPSIRKHGAYMTEDTIKEALTTPDFIIQLATALKEEQEKRRELENTVEVQRQAIEDFAPVQHYVDSILSSRGTMTTSQIAADYDLTANKLNKILHQEGIQRNVSGQWILYRKHMGKGYTKSETIPITHHDGTPGTVLHTRWTQKGRLMIHDILAARGIEATMDKE